MKNSSDFIKFTCIKYKKKKKEIEAIDTHLYCGAFPYFDFLSQFCDFEKLKGGAIIKRAWLYLDEKKTR